MSQWQPIETAPRDGREILCYEDGIIRVCHPFRFPRPVSEGWDDLDKSKPGDRWCIMRLDANEIEGVTHGHTWSMHPTHWMPLPAPPADRA
jgi:hypothetical protein